jgi:hypothetical protein
MRLNGILVAAILASAAIFTAGAGSTAFAQGACAEIRSACRAAGFHHGGAGAGRGLEYDCMDPILHHTAPGGPSSLPLPQVDPQLVAACLKASAAAGGGPAVTVQSAPPPPPSPAPPPPPPKTGLSLPVIVGWLASLAVIGVGLAVFLAMRSRRAGPRQGASVQPPSEAPAIVAAAPIVPAAEPGLAKTHDVFISYSSQDKPTADAICAVMEHQGIRCWIAPRDVLPGQQWAGSILRAIAKARVVVLVFSAASNTSPQVLREIERAVHNGTAIIPFRIEDVPFNESLEFFISTPHWLDALTPPLEAHAARLAESVKSLLGHASV